MGVLSVILAIVAVACGLLATMLFGTTGIIITAVIAVVAIALGLFKRSKDKKGGIPGIVIAVVAVILAVSVNGVWQNLFKEAHQKAVEYMPDGLWAQISEDTSGGLMGIVNKLPKDEASLQAFINEMNELNKLTENK